VRGKLPVIDILFRSFVGGLGVAGVAATAWTFWRFVVAPTNGRPFSEDFTMVVIVAAIAGYIAAVYARFNPAFEKDAPSMAHLSI
jgi:branched-subunit amino acid ABC-type transport system permease component